MSKKPWKLLALALPLFVSCEKTISFRPIDQTPKLVVEATIENDNYPVVYLSTSLDFFSTISAQKLAQSFVHDALVYISDGTNTQQLKEYSLGIENGYAVYYYTVDSANLIQAFRGSLGNAYSLKIQVDGQEYTASTTIPLLTKQISSMYFESNVDKEDTTKVSLFAKFDDPPGLGNYIRYFTRVNHQPFYPGLNSVFDDEVIDGKTYTVQVEKGVDRNSTIDFNNYAFFHHGDTITVKLCDIDKATFDFWQTMEYSYSSIGNPFSSPTKVTGNISNGALGYFGGYAASFSNIIIPE